jgi:16S rRNA (guanine527-N7)-methyltransferase
LRQEDPLEPLRVHVREYGISLSDGQMEQFSRYLRGLMLWNERFNLTGLKSPERIVTELFLDSLVPASRIPPEGSLLDVGSGAGLPGLPLKILYPDLQVHLLDARAKRVSFLKEMVRLLGLSGIEVIRGRIEQDLSALPLACYPWITARALAQFPQAIRWCSPPLCEGGVLVCYLGEHGAELLAEHRLAVEAAGLDLQEVIPYKLPGKSGGRNAVLLRKPWTAED